jgi:N-methylhydantoinase A
MSTSVAVDVGGTFTDVVAHLPDGATVSTKVPSTPSDPSIGVVGAIADVAGAGGVGLSAFDLLLHGTTVATNAVLQRRGATTALLTTEGFRDVLEIGRQARPRLFDLDSSRVEPLVPRALRLEIGERQTATGGEVAPVDVESVRRAVEVLRDRGVDAVAVCLLHSYASGAHEREVRRLVSSWLPELHVTCSSDILSEYREYERTSTTVLNAYVAPLMDRYLHHLGSGLATGGISADLRLMQSSGGLMTVRRAQELPAATVMSGIAAGAVGGAVIGAAAGHGMVLTLDMGGTSTDMALALDGRVRAVRTHAIDGFPIRLPALDVHTIGAGGGSIAFVDGAVLRVGPRSAGAAPGPAAYAAGGHEPTVTDANLLLGRLPDEGLLGGRLPLRRDLAEAAVRRVAEPLGLDPMAAAQGIVAIINATMARQIRVLTVERGADPRECTLVAFGGGGPVHAVDLARELGIGSVLIPPRPGVTSAMGLMLSDMRADAVQTAMVEIDPSAECSDALINNLAELFATVERRALADLPDGVGRPVVVREVEARYRRQGHELRVAVDGGQVDRLVVERLVSRFDDVHRARYGYDVEGEPVVIVNVLATATLPTSSSGVDVVTDGDRPMTRVPRRRNGARSRAAFFDGAKVDALVVDRAGLEVGDHMAGPAIVEQYDTTTVIPPGASAVVDPARNLVIAP